MSTRIVSSYMTLNLGGFKENRLVRRIIPKFNWSLGAYCGPGRAANRIGDEFLGPFTKACRTHDFCYSAAGEQITKEMNEGYLKTRTQRTTRRTELKQQCDSRLSEDLSETCSQVPNDRRSNCRSSAQAYTAFTITLGAGALTSSINAAAACVD